MWSMIEEDFRLRKQGLIDRIRFSLERMNSICDGKFKASSQRGKALDPAGCNDRPEHSDLHL
jgi:hypothetical protein